jgi:hypothetical protein
MALKKPLLVVAVVAAAGASFAGAATAAAGKAPVLDRQVLGPWFSAPVTSCAPADGGASVELAYSLRGLSTLPYSSSYTAAGTARLALVGGDGYLASLQTSFTLPSTIGTVTGTIAAGPATKGQGTCDVATGAAVLEVRGAVYTAQLPDGTTDTGVVDIELSSPSGGSAFLLTFDSTRSPEVDSDGDRVWDGDDNCETTPNADQRDVDVDYIGDACDAYDNRPALTLVGELWGETQSVRNGSKLLSKLDHAITALKAGQVSVACTDVAGYIAQVQAARGKTIPVATADVLIAKARHIRTVLGLLEPV